ncbi:MAG: alpha/beta fold hydrolase [Burkholderiales bacterium]|nr:MAG: alpha/beta fold hydrolase [Burkholderiales bacterium]
MPRVPEKGPATRSARAACCTESPAMSWLDRYRAPRWLPGAHPQTIYPALLAPRPRIGYTRMRWETPDGDFIDIDTVALGAADDRRPLVVLFHGLEGSSHSHYALATMAAVVRRGWRGAVPHFRGCSGEPNRLPRAYHSGDSDEIDWILRRIKREHARASPLYAVGVSLGGNALLKWLGERGDGAGFVTAAAAISAPMDLAAGAHSLARGFNRNYTENFLRSLRRKSLAMARRFPGLLEPRRVRDSRTFFDFDEHVTAPLHGFAGAHDYWRRSSSRQFLHGVRVPTLVVNARNDPFQPAAALARPADVSPFVTLEQPATGGHVGFIAGRFPGRLEWLGERVLDFLAGERAASANAETPAHADG